MKVRYQIGDKVVFKTNGISQIGVITSKKSAEKKTYYSLRSEAGSGFVMVPVDKAKNKSSAAYAVIDSELTAAWNGALEAEAVTPTRLFAKDGVGHTRANYAEDIELWFDGENTTPYSMVQHMERNNDLIFKTQGPRSF